MLSSMLWSSIYELSSILTKISRQLFVVELLTAD
jgi:hypothetical protein